MNHQIRSKLFLFSLNTFLFSKVTFIKHACQFNNATQLHLPPSTTGLWFTQGSNQIRSLPLKAELTFPQTAQLFDQFFVSTDTLFFNAMDFSLEFIQCLAHRLYRFLDAPVVLGQVPKIGRASCRERVYVSVL